MTEYCFHSTKNFSGIVKKFHLGVKIVILEIPVFLRILWSGIVGAIHTFAAEHVANMLS